MKIIDVTGEIYNEMWSYGPPFPEFKKVEIELPDWVDYKSYSQAFNGFHMLTGTYLVAPSHGLGLKKSYALNSISIEKLYDINAFVLKFDLKLLLKEKNNPFISCNDIKTAQGKKKIPEGSAILVATGWGKHWGRADYLKNYYFLKKDALDYLLERKPFLLGLDTPSMDNLSNPQGLSNYFYNHNVLLLAPLVNLETIESFHVKLTVCPLRIKETTGLPCRAVVVDKYKET